MYNLNEVYIISDQPTTCPKCGARTEIILSLDYTIEKTQFLKCLFESCKYEFVMQEDIDFAQ